MTQDEQQVRQQAEVETAAKVDADLVEFVTFSAVGSATRPELATVELVGDWQSRYEVVPTLQGTLTLAVDDEGAAHVIASTLAAVRERAMRKEWTADGHNELTAPPADDPALQAAADEVEAEVRARVAELVDGQHAALAERGWLPGPDAR